MPRDPASKPNPSGIAKAAIEGAKASDRPDETIENNQAFPGSGGIAMPVPSAQPVKGKPTERPAQINAAWTEDEDEDTEWRRAGGADPDNKS